MVAVFATQGILHMVDRGRGPRVNSTITKEEKKEEEEEKEEVEEEKINIKSNNP